MLTKMDFILRFGVTTATIEIGTFTVGVATFTVGERRWLPYLLTKI